MRMRRRRVERCLLRASVALEAGVLEDAREAIEEAARLNPNDPDVEQLASELTRAEHSPAVEDVQQAPWEIAPSAPRRGVAATLLLASLGAAGWWWASALRDAPREKPSLVGAPAAMAPAAAIPPADPAVHVSETSITAPVVNAPLPQPETTALATAGSASGAESNVPATDAATPAIAQSLESAPRAISPDRSQSEALSASEDGRNERVTAVPSLRPGALNLSASPTAAGVSNPPKLDPLPALPETPEPAPRVVAGADGLTPPNTAARIPLAVAPAPGPAPAVPAAAAVSDEQSIRAVLDRYESAYSRLDAAAAGSVWPSVNQRALANAFQGLSAQTISLGRCDIRVNGASARAECSGNARWTPKVGGGGQSAARQWRFDLRNAAGNWLITQATTR